jgi:hypothetical protein
VLTECEGVVCRGHGSNSLGEERGGEGNRWGRKEEERVGLLGDNLTLSKTDKITSLKTQQKRNSRSYKRWDTLPLCRT